MTFYEAALRILEESGAPLHADEITKRAIEKGMLSHIGKTPEVTMLARLAAMAKRSIERRLSVTAKDTFALTEWMLVEDPAALDATGVFLPHPEESQPALRSVERHPEPHAEYLRAIGRQADRKRRDDDVRKKSYPPVSEVAFEVLQEAGALAPAELLARLKQRDLVDDLSNSSLIEQLASDNQRRIDDNRKPNFSAVRSESGELQLSVESGTEGGPSPLEIQQAFCAAANLKFENGRVVLRSESRTHSQAAVASAMPISSDDVGLVSQVRHVVKDARRAMGRIFRKRLTDLDSGTFEKSVSKMLHGLGFRELKTSRRTQHSVSFTAKKRDGSLELRYLIRVLRGNTPVERKHVQEVKRDLGHHGTNLGIVVSVGDVRGDARAEALSASPIFLWCGDGLAEKFLEAEIGVKVMRAEMFELDEDFFVKAKADAEESAKRREERKEDKGRSFDAEEKSNDRPSAPQQNAQQQSQESAESVPADVAATAEDGEEDGPEEPGVAGSEETGEAKSRRRRRRRRRNRTPGTLAPANATEATASADASTAVSDGPSQTKSQPEAENATISSDSTPRSEGES
jgi:ribonuclease E